MCLETVICNCTHLPRPNADYYVPVVTISLGDNNRVCREQAQKHYQKLTRELTQGQLLRLEHRQTFVQQASLVLLRGHLVVKGQAAGAPVASL